MARISQYPIDASISDEDQLLGSDAENSNATKMFTVGALAAYINGESPGSPGSGTVTSVSGEGTVSGITLSGEVTSSGSLTLGGSLSLTSQEIINFLGYTPYNASNPDGFTSFAEPAIFSGGGTPTLASGVTAEEIRTLIGAGDGTGSIESVTGTAPIVSSGGANPAISISAATTSAAGSMSSADKTKLDGIDDTAENFVKNTTDTFTPSAKITQIVTLTQAQYDGIGTPSGSTLYIIL